MPKTPTTLLEYLVAHERIPPELASMFQEEVGKDGRSVEKVLLENGVLSEEELLLEKSNFFKLPYRILRGQRVSSAALAEISEDAARTYEVVPLTKEGQFLDVGVLDPEDVRAKEALQFLAVLQNLTLRTFLISPSDYQAVLKEYRTLGGEVTQALQELQGELERGKEVKAETALAGEGLTEEAPIIRLVAVTLRHAKEGRASDIHIEPSRETLNIRFRVDGTLYTSLRLPMRIHPPVVARVKILANMKIDETRIPQDGRFHTVIDETDIDFRVATFPTTNGEKVAIRILDPSVGLQSLEELGLVGRSLDVVHEGSKRPFGLILLTGPTGSGKSTTLYAILRSVISEKVNIVSLEDPVEYFIRGVNQSQTHEEIGYTFATGLRHILRGDPNIIMVGEIRDTETAQLAVHAGLTGHLVLSTLHTNNALGVIPRLIDMGVAPFLIPSTLAVAGAQRLVQKLCPDCKKAIILPTAIQSLVDQELAKIPERERRARLKKPPAFFAPQGCLKCGRRGTKGRMAIFEALNMTRELEYIILHEISETRINEEAKRQGMVTLFQDGVIKASQGLVAMEEVLRVVQETT